MARHIYLCPLRWADMDSLGHVNNVTYVDYLQEARVDMLRVHAPATGGEELAEGTSWSGTRSSSSPRWSSARAGPDRVVGDRIRAASFTMAYEILDESPTGERGSTPGPGRCWRRTCSPRSGRAGSATGAGGAGAVPRAGRARGGRR